MPTNRSLSAHWAQQKVDPRDRRCRIANRAMRMVYQLVGGRQVWRGRGVNREYLLAKIREFHRDHMTPLDQTIRDMSQALEWLPTATFGEEAQPLIDMAAKKSRGATSIGDLLIPLLMRLGVCVGEDPEVKSTTSEARGSD